VTDRSVVPAVVVAVAVLFPGTGSTSAPATLAVFTSRPGRLTVTVIETVVPVRGGRVPRAHVTTPDAAWQVGDPGTEETNETSLGRASVRVTAVAGVALLLVMPSA
jgi:hypothetical protein